MTILKTGREQDFNPHLCVVKEPYLESNMQPPSTLVVRYKNRPFIGVFFADKWFYSVRNFKKYSLMCCNVAIEYQIQINNIKGKNGNNYNKTYS